MIFSKLILVMAIPKPMAPTMSEKNLAANNLCLGFLLGHISLAKVTADVFICESAVDIDIAIIANISIPEIPVIGEYLFTISGINASGSNLGLITNKDIGIITIIILTNTKTIAEIIITFLNLAKLLPMSILCNMVGATKDCIKKNKDKFIISQNSRSFVSNILFKLNRLFSTIWSIFLSEISA
ncbi:hypothetical protein IHI24_000896 [Rickettsia endosymbiont of Cardiosporidium cionae]|nr:hypothetical protein IHI24_000896 [Rickettsia endosymbiont of Cardiosporidium cionae]